MFKKKHFFVILSIVFMLMGSNLYGVSLEQAVLAQPPNVLDTDNNIQQPNIIRDFSRFRDLAEANLTANPNNIGSNQGMFSTNGQPSEPQSLANLQSTTPGNFTIEYSDTAPTLTEEQLEDFKEELEEEVNPSDFVPLVNTNISGPEPGTQTNTTTNLEAEMFSNISQSLVSPSLSTVSLGAYERVSELEKRHTYSFGGVNGISGPPGNLVSVLEPSIANNGPIIFYTSNFFGGRSLDNGRTWQFDADPTLGMGLYFPSGEPRGCCDQDVIFDPQNQIFIWYTQAEQDADGRNYFRLAVSKDAQSWWFWTFSPGPSLVTGFSSGAVIRRTGIGFDAEGSTCADANDRTCFWFDYPQLAISANTLYITTNVYAGNEGEGPLGHVSLASRNP